MGPLPHSLGQNKGTPEDTPRDSVTEGEPKGLPSTDPSSSSDTPSDREVHLEAPREQWGRFLSHRVEGGEVEDFGFSSSSSYVSYSWTSGWEPWIDGGGDRLT